MAQKQQNEDGARRPRRWYTAAAAFIVFLGLLAWLTPTGVRDQFGKNPTTSASRTAEAIRSIAILPFDQLPREKNELLGLGMADAIIGRMSGLERLVVLPTNAVSRFQGQPKDAIATGKRLNVDAVLDGTIQKSEGRVRVTVQLINVRSRRTLWADTFDQTFTDIFAIQDSISEKVARSLLVNLSAEDRQQLVKHFTGDTAAYESYLLGVSAYNLRTKEGLQKAIDYFQQAVASDPHYALAYAMMSDTYFLQSFYSYESSTVTRPKALAAAERALALDSSLPEAHLAMSAVQRHDTVDSPGVQSLLRAIRLNPNHALAHQRYAWFLCIIGELEQGVQEMSKAQVLDPLSGTQNAALGGTLVFARRFPEALRYCERAAELNSKMPSIQNTLATVYLLNGKYDEAIAASHRMEELDPTQHGEAITQIATTLVRADRKREAEKLIPEILALAKQNKVDAYNVALLYIARGENSETLDWLERESHAIAQMPCILRYDPQLDPVRSDPRFQVLLSKYHISSTEKIHSIAILPFRPLGSENNDERLGLGMADAVIGRLSGLKQLIVLPTAAVSGFRSQQEDAIAAGKKLNVDAVLNGTVQKDQGRIRVTVQLVNVGSRRTLWADTFDQTYTDIFAIQDSISSSVARSLLSNLSEADKERLVKHYTGDMAAYDSYLLGVASYNLRTKDGLQKAISYFQRAIAADPHYALAYALMSDCYFLQSYYSYEPYSVTIPKAEAAAQMALELDSSLPEAQLAISTLEGDGPADSEESPGIRALLRAIHLNPNYALAHQRYAWYLCSCGRLEEALQEMGKAQSLDPLSPTNSSALGIMLIFAKRYGEALHYCTKAAELNPDEPSIQLNLSAAHLANRNYEEAIACLHRLEELDPLQHGDAVAQIASVLTSANRITEADELIPEALTLANGDKVNPYNMALLYIARGEYQEAISWLARAEKKVESSGTSSFYPLSRLLRYDPQLDPIRPDARFRVLFANFNRHIMQADRTTVGERR